MIMFRLVNRRFRSEMATARRRLAGLSLMLPKPAFCAASDIASGEGDAENGDREKDAGDTKLRVCNPVALGEGDPNPKELAPGEWVNPTKEFRGERVPREKLLRGEGDARPKLARGEGIATPLVRGDGEAKDMLPKGRELTGSALVVGATLPESASSAR